MSEIFISYKRDDEARIARLVRALESTALSVWWDRSLPGGENWRRQVENALDAAKCVIVVWTHNSVGPAGDFVRDEASQAKRRGVLVPVLMDKVDPPLGFGEIQAIDLTHWNGSSRDPFFQDLSAAVTAKLEGRAIPQAKGPRKRLTRRLAYSSFASGVVFSALAFGLNLFRAQNRICGIPLLQPHISDVCGALGLGDRPIKRERIAWADRELGSCAPLRTYIERFPNGTYRGEAASLLAARRVTQTEVWTATTRLLELFEPQGDIRSTNKPGAQAIALAHAQALAERECRGFAATTSFRFRSATAAAEEWNCSSVDKQVTCSFAGKAVCELEERLIQEIETCGK